MRFAGEGMQRLSDPGIVVREALGLPQEALARMASALQASIKRFAEQFLQAAKKFLQNPPPALLKFVADLQRIESAPPVPGYEATLIANGHDRLGARILGLNLSRLGKQRLQEIRAERRLASAIFGVVKAGNATPLVMSRRARPIKAALDDEMAMPALCDAWAQADLSGTAYSIGDLAERATRRDAAACIRLGEICAALKPFMSDPRGRFPSEASVTHELQLYLLRQAYTYDPVDDIFRDPATQATEIAMHTKKFDPRPAYRRVMKRKSRLN